MEHDPTNADQQRSTSQPESQPQQSSESGDRVFDIIEDVERRLSSLRDIQKTHDDQISTLTERSKALDAREKELGDREADLRHQRDELMQKQEKFKQQCEAFEATSKEHKDKLSEARKRVEEKEQELAGAENAFTSKHAELEQQRQEIESNRSEIDKIKSELESSRKELESTHAKIAEREKALSEQQESLAAENDTLTSEKEELTRRVEQAESNVGELVQKTEELQTTLELRDKELAETRDKLNVAGEKLQKFAESLNDQAQMAERGAAAMAEVDRLREELERVKTEGASDSDLTEELERRNRRIGELTEALHQARGQSANRGDESEEIAKRDREIKELVDEVERLERAAASATSSEIDILKRRVEELEADLAKAQSTGGVDDKDLAEKAAVVRNAAEHLRRRRNRLAACKRALKKQGGAIAKGPSASADDFQRLKKQEQDLQLQRQALAETQAALAASEATLIKKWARPKAVVTLGWLIVLAVIIACASWFTVDRMFPATVAASATINATSTSGKPLTSQQRETWEERFEGLMTDATFHGTLAKRMEARRLKAYATPEAIAQRLATDVGVDASGNGSIVLTMAGTNRTELRSVMDIITGTAMRELDRKTSGAQNGVKATVADVHTVGGQPQYTTINPVPVKDERLIYAGAGFGAAYALCLFIILFLYARLKKAKSAFEDDNLSVEAI